MIFMTNCSKNESCVMPIFPKPTKEVSYKIKSLNDKAVDGWMMELVQLKEKLEVQQ